MHKQQSSQSAVYIFCIDRSVMSGNVGVYGSWASPITSDLVIQESVSLQDVRIDPLDKGHVYWSEALPEQGGRTVICKRKHNHKKCDVITPDDYYVRTLVHEYGGGSFIVYNETVYFSNFQDQRLYRQHSKAGAKPEPITPEGKKWRYADAQVVLGGKVLVCVREDHDVLSNGAIEPMNTVVAIDLQTQKQHVLVTGNNFYSSPRVSSNGMIAWVQWNHPNMPWDDTELWVGKLTDTGDAIVEGSKKKVSGGTGISVMQPQWSSSDQLFYLNDKTNWWNLYRLESDGAETNICPLEKEFGQPQWAFGCNDYICIPGSKDIVVTYGDKLSILKPDGSLVEIPTQTTVHTNLACNGDMIYLETGSPTQFLNISEIDLKKHSVTVLRESASVDIDADYYSVPKEISYPTTNNGTSHGYYYAPKNKDYKAPDGTLPPLLVKVHGGPTSACSSVLNLKLQYFTSRGFAILDVNYRGSTGYGRQYRNELRLNWGIVDIDDCCQGALYLANVVKEVDINKLTIDGGSAGGYATLSCLTFRDVFKAGASFYGISDVEVLAKETHKFESRYVDNLIGPYPEDKDTYIERSPIYHTDQLNCALVLFQGDEDKVVPPNQSEMMFQAVKEKGLPVAYKLYEGEQHGFRKAENIKDSLEGELYFFSKVFGFEAPGLTVDLEVYNLDRVK